MNIELEQTLLDIAEAQDAIKENLIKLEKKINKLDESKKLLFSDIDNTKIFVNHLESKLDNCFNKIDTYIKSNDDRLISLKTQIADLQKRNTIVAEEGDIVYYKNAFGEINKCEIVKVIDDKSVVVKYCSWWLPRLIGNENYRTLSKNEIFYKNKENYIIK